MTAPPEAPEPHQARLLPTSREDVAEVRGELGAFCAAQPEFEAAYVCRVERLWPSREPQQSLSFIVKLAKLMAGPDDAPSETRAVCDRFIQQHGALARELGVGVLADRAVPAWDKNAQRIYPPTG